MELKAGAQRKKKLKKSERSSNQETHSGKQKIVEQKH